MGTGTDTVDIWATAFADDLTIIAPSHGAIHCTHGLHEHIPKFLRY
jgi:hypothetical protein